MPKGEKSKQNLKPATKVGAKAVNEAHSPEQISPFNIRRNPENPRIDFEHIEDLAESIEEQGVLVPLTVFREPDAETEYVLLDGERRWRAARHINAESVPAWRVKKPEGIDNVVRMFNIHMMREEWGEMATALALEKIIDAIQTDDVDALRKRTGLSKDRINNIKRVLRFPKEYRKKVLSGTIPFNFLVELDKAILSKKRDTKKADVISKSEAQVRDIFLKKWEDGSIDDVVDLRKVGILIDTAAKAPSEKVRDRAKRAIDDLITRADASINDAFHIGAASSVEMKSILRDVDALPDRISDLADSDLDDEQRERLLKALARLANELKKSINKLSHA